MGYDPSLALEPRGRTCLAPIVSTSFVVLLAATLPAAADTPMSFLQSFGAKADRILPLTWGLTIISILVAGIVGALLLWALFAAPRCSAEPEEQLPVDRPKGGLSWIYVGVGLSCIVLFGSALWTMVTLAAVGQPPEKPAFTIEVTGHQWWWQVRYLDDEPSQSFVTANEIHIPVGKPVAVTLASADVIHSFWVPALTGKTDLIPGQTNQTWFEASEPGLYRGQCTEYCGAQHAHMGLLVVASPPEEFNAWWSRQLEAAKAPLTEAARQGRGRIRRPLRHLPQRPRHSGRRYPRTRPQPSHDAAYDRCKHVAEQHRQSRGLDRRSAAREAREQHARPRGGTRPASADYCLSPHVEMRGQAGVRRRIL